MTLIELKKYISMVFPDLLFYENIGGLKCCEQSVIRYFVGVGDSESCISIAPDLKYDASLSYANYYISVVKSDGKRTPYLSEYNRYAVNEDGAIKEHLRFLAKRYKEIKAQKRTFNMENDFV